MYIFKTPLQGLQTPVVPRLLFDMQAHSQLYYV